MSYKPHFLCKLRILDFNSPLMIGAINQRGKTGSITYSTDSTVLPVPLPFKVPLWLLLSCRNYSHYSRYYPYQIYRFDSKSKFPYFKRNFQSFRFAVISGFINVREPHEQLGDRVQPQILIPFRAILSFFCHISLASCLPILLFLSHSIFIYPLHTHREWEMAWWPTFLRLSIDNITSLYDKPFHTFISFLLFFSSTIFKERFSSKNRG